MEVMCVIDCLCFSPPQKKSKNRQNRKLLTVTRKTPRHLHPTEHPCGALACPHKVLQSSLRSTAPPPSAVRRLRHPSLSVLAVVKHRQL